jgi:hypothetical protein
MSLTILKASEYYTYQKLSILPEHVLMSSVSFWI